MHCSIPGSNVKVLAKAVSALSKVGDEMYVQPQKNSISFRTVNLANSAYADFTFHESYFFNYTCKNVDKRDQNKCKISMRSAISVFKGANLDKQIETCDISLELDVCEILFVLKYKNGITKNYLVPILDSEILHVTYEKESSLNRFSCQTRVLIDASHNFHQNLIEITLEASDKKLLLRNYLDDTSGKSHVTRTQLVLVKEEFDQYSISNETKITFCMRELKAILTFAESVGLSVEAYFQTEGRPVIFTLKDACFEANLVLSTVGQGMDTQANSTLTNKKASSYNKNSSARKRKIATEPAHSFQTVTKQKKVKKQTVQDSRHFSYFKGSANVSINTSPGNKIDCDSPSDPQLSTTSRSVKQSIEKNKSNRSGIETYDNIVSQGNDINIGQDELSKCTRRPANASDCSLRSKKLYTVFHKFFQEKFDPTVIPGYNVIIVEDSDESDN